MKDFNLWGMADMFLSVEHRQEVHSASQLLAMCLRGSFGSRKAVDILSGAVGNCQEWGCPTDAPLYRVVFEALREIVEVQPFLKDQAETGIIQGKTPVTLRSWIYERSKSSV